MSQSLDQVGTTLRGQDGTDLVPVERAVLLEPDLDQLPVVEGGLDGGDEAGGDALLAGEDDRLDAIGQALQVAPLLAFELGQFLS